MPHGRHFTDPSGWLSPAARPGAVVGANAEVGPSHCDGPPSAWQTCQCPSAWKCLDHGGAKAAPLCVAVPQKFSGGAWRVRWGRGRGSQCRRPAVGPIPFVRRQEGSCIGRARSERKQRRRGLRQRQLSRHGTPGLGAEAAEPAAPSAALVRSLFSRPFGTVGPEVRRHPASPPLDRQLNLQRAALQFAGRDLIQSFHILLSGHFGVERGHNMRFQASLRLSPGDLPRNLRTWVAVVRGPETTHAHLIPRSVPPLLV